MKEGTKERMKERTKEGMKKGIKVNGKRNVIGASATVIEWHNSLN